MLILLILHSDGERAHYLARTVCRIDSHQGRRLLTWNDFLPTLHRRRNSRIHRKSRVQRADKPHISVDDISSSPILSGSRLTTQVRLGLHHFQSHSNCSLLGHTFLVTPFSCVVERRALPGRIVIAMPGFRRKIRPPCDSRLGEARRATLSARIYSDGKSEPQVHKLSLLSSSLSSRSCTSFVDIALSAICPRYFSIRLSAGPNHHLHTKLAAIGVAASFSPQ